MTVEGLWMDRHPVADADFAAFVEATGHVTAAEHRPDPADYPGVDTAVLVAGSLVFHRPRHTSVAATLVAVLADYANSLETAGGHLYLPGLDPEVA